MNHNETRDDESVPATKLPRSVIAAGTLIPLGFVLFVGSITWGAARWMELQFSEIRIQARDIQRSINDMMDNRWTSQDQEIYSLKLKLNNPTLIVPEPSGIIDRRQQKK